MFKTLATILFSFLIVSCGPAKHDDAETAIPENILYSVATLCQPVPETQPGKASAGSGEMLADDWRQIEFVPAANRDYITSKLAELKAFEQQHRKDGGGFSDVFVRPEHPVSLRSLNFPAANLPHLPEIGLNLDESIVAGGFGLGDESDWFIYGQRSANGKILELAVSPGYGTVPSEKFIRALSEIAGSQLLLVDWYAGVIVDTASPESVAAWAQRYKSLQ